jgi:uncharacterized membrane protein
MARWRWLIEQLIRRLWVRATLIGALGILSAILAAVIEPFIPWEIHGTIGADAVESLLTIIASSMLAVATFSLSTMVSAYSSATSSVSPRATRLLIEDRVSQTVLSTFVGSFLFSIVGLIVLKTGAYGERGRVVLFVMTIAIIALVVVTLLRWIDHLTSLGRVGETTDRVERATREAREARLDEPYLGGRPWRDGPGAMPAGATAITAKSVGYVQNVDMPALSKFCDMNDTEVFVNAVPGSFVYADSTLAWITPAAAPDDLGAFRDCLCAAFLIDEERSFDQDPRFGLSVMSEIACRALSPAVNDPGTAIDVIGRATRLLSIWGQGASRKDAAGKPMHPRVHVPPLLARDIVEDAFMTLARDGAGLIEVQLRLQKALLALARVGNESFRNAVLQQSHMALDRAEAAMTLEADKQRLRAVLER